MQRLVHYAPRMLGIAGILFWGMFALDVFEPGVPFHEVAIALFMHLIPNYILLAILVIAWRWERLGGILFIVAGLAPLYFFARNPLWINAILGGPFIATGALFLVSDWYKRLNTART